MTTDTDKASDKLVEMALKSGAVNHFVQGLPDRYAFSLSELTSFRAAIIADLCGDVEPVAFMYPSDLAEFERKEMVAEAVSVSCTSVVTHERTVPLYSASTVAALKARATDWQRLYDRAINEANGLTNYVEDRPELRSAERRLDVIAADARALKGQP